MLVLTLRASLLQVALRRLADASPLSRKEHRLLPCDGERSQHELHVGAANVRAFRIREYECIASNEDIVRFEQLLRETSATEKTQ